MSATFHYTCECGYALPIAASSAGTIVPCRCGKQIKVPRLSELKRLSGQPVESIVGIAAYLQTMYLDNQLPPDTHCVVCQKKTAKILACWVECEKVWERQGKNWGLALLFVFSIPLWLVARMMQAPDKPEVLGRDLVVQTPLPMCEDCLQSTSLDESTIRQFLLGIDLYRQLLERYPEAEVGSD